MFTLGFTCGNPTTGSSLDSERTASVTSWHLQNEEFVQRICLVARNVEDQVRSCAACQQQTSGSPTAPLEWPERPWVRLHIDYAGLCFGKYFLVLIDSHSKWLEVHPVTTATSAVTIEKLKFIFSTHGLPDMIVSDNGSVQYKPATS